MLGDPFLVNVFKQILRGADHDEIKLLLLDLLLCCCDDFDEEILRNIREINRPMITLAFYFRVIGLYFFRFHRDQEKRRLKRIISELRKIHRFMPLSVPA